MQSQILYFKDFRKSWILSNSTDLMHFKFIYTYMACGIKNVNFYILSIGMHISKEH